MDANPLPSADVLRQLLRYDAASGTLFWLPRGDSFNKSLVGKEALNAITNKGYRRGVLLGQGAFAHRVIWKMVNGCEPAHIDHIDGDRANNRIDNLRSIAPAENYKNRRKQKNNTSGFIGVAREKGRWCASISHNGKRQRLGSFNTIEEAIEARERAEREMGFHPNHGR